MSNIILRGRNAHFGCIHFRSSSFNRTAVARECPLIRLIHFQNTHLVKTLRIDQFSRCELPRCGAPEPHSLASVSLAALRSLLAEPWTLGAPRNPGPTLAPTLWPLRRGPSAPHGGAHGRMGPWAHGLMDSFAREPSCIIIE